MSTVADVQRLARRHYNDRYSLVRAVLARLRRLWLGMDRAAIDASWAQIGPQVVTAVRAGQLAAANHADDYTTAVLEAQGLDGAIEGQVVAAAFVGVASDGRSLDSLFEFPVIVAKNRIGRGDTIGSAMRSGLAELLMLASTQIGDAGRGADSVAIVAHRKAGGYTRMLVPPSCARCALLAGRFFRYNRGFLRHPQCDCVHIPSTESTTELRTDPRQYFESLPASEQDKIFTRAGARAIRDGADIFQVVNARKGMSTADVFGRRLRVTNEGTSRRGYGRTRMNAQGVQGPRLTPDAIYQIAQSRDEALKLLRQYGYLS